MRGVRVPDDDGPTTWQAVPDPIGAAPRPGPAVRLPGVYRPQTDTLLLATAMSREGIGSGMDVLDLCTGTGTLALHAARLGARVTAVDISRRAVASARLNTVLARLPVTVRRGDLLRTLPGLTFDAVISNPRTFRRPASWCPGTGPAGPGTRAPTDG